MQQLALAARRTTQHLAWLLVLFAASATVTQAAAIPSASFSGEWLLDSAASDDFDAKLDTYLSAARLRERERDRRRRPAGVDNIEALAGTPDEIPLEASDRTRQRLVDAFRPSARLTVELMADHLSLTADAAPSRSYVLNETSTRMDSSGTASITAAWSGAALVIRSKFTNKALHVQQLSLDRNGDALRLLLQVKDPMGIKLQVATTYRRKTGG